EPPNTAKFTPTRITAGRGKGQPAHLRWCRSARRGGKECEVEKAARQVRAVDCRAGFCGGVLKLSNSGPRSMAPHGYSIAGRAASPAGVSRLYWTSAPAGDDDRAVRAGSTNVHAWPLPESRPMAGR